MRPDRVRPGIISYRPMPVSMYERSTGQFYALQSPAPRRVAGARPARASRATWILSNNVAIFLGDYSATTSACVLCQPEGASFERVLTVENYCHSAIEPPQAEPILNEASVIEMRPAHRSLRDKAQEEMSEFEREYPW